MANIWKKEARKFLVLDAQMFKLRHSKHIHLTKSRNNYLLTKKIKQSKDYKVHTVCIGSASTSHGLHSSDFHLPK